MPDPIVDAEITGHGARSFRYPTPFFDLAQYYQPASIKEMFKWCSYYYYNNPLVGSTINKLSRFPITAPIFEDKNDRVRYLWWWWFTEVFAIQDVLMEVNLDLNVYGNAYVSLHMPFSRLLVCVHCQKSTDIKSLPDWKWSSSTFMYRCPHCQKTSYSDPSKGGVRDIPLRNSQQIKLIRWNPEQVFCKYNEATGSSVYSYMLPPLVRWQIQNGDKDVLSEIPLLFLEAFKKQRLIRLSNEHIFHLKRPTLAEKDFGYGKPLIIHVLKDLYYLTTLRRAQEAIAVEHITPFDLLFPAQNSASEPYTHTNLASWRLQMEKIVEMHRKDPNFKGIAPVPIGTTRLGGDGKALLITPELQYMNQTIVGGMGISAEFLFGNMNWTGSSISLRSLANDLRYSQTQLLRLTRWIKDKVRVFMRWPDIGNIRFTDFKMADDIQRVQQFIALNTQKKVSDRTLLTEMGLDYEEEMKRIAKETQSQDDLNIQIAKGQARAQGEASLIAYEYQRKLQMMQAQDGAIMQQMSGQQSLDPNAAVSADGTSDQDGGAAALAEVRKIQGKDPLAAAQHISRVKQENPALGMAVEEKYRQTPQEADTNMTALPEKAMPRRGGTA